MDKQYAYIELYKQFNKVTYYSIKLENEDGTKQEFETDKFFRKFLGEPDNPLIDAQIIYDSIIEIGNRGAYDRYFRFEGKANALPPKIKFLRELGQPTSDLSLRLYCIKLNQNIVILINGAEKTADTAQDCPNVVHHFRRANKIATQIDNALYQKDIIVDFDKLIIDRDFIIEL